MIYNTIVNCQKKKCNKNTISNTRKSVNEKEGTSYFVDTVANVYVKKKCYLSLDNLNVIDRKSVV